MTMKANPIAENEFYDKIKIPSRPHTTDELKDVTEELESRMRIADELECLGISISKFDAEDGHEDSDELQAIILVNEGKKVPEDLKKRLIDKQKKKCEKESKK